MKTNNLIHFEQRVLGPPPVRLGPNVVPPVRTSADTWGIATGLAQGDCQWRDPKVPKKGEILGVDTAFGVSTGLMQQAWRFRVHSQVQF